MLTLALICLLIVKINGDSVIHSGEQLQLRLDTTNSNVFELGQNVFTRLPYGDEAIEITCSKTNCLEDGVLEAAVNSNLAVRQPCSVYLGNWSREDKCLVQKFKYMLYRNDMSGIYDIVCRVEGNSGVEVNYRIVKLFVDSHPRLRTGLKLHHHSSIIFYKLDSRPRLSCEAVQDLRPVWRVDELIGRFDRIEWFVYETDQLINVTTTRVLHLYGHVFNFSSEFVPPQPDQLALNIPYKCCTMSKSEKINCQAVFYVH